MTKYITGFIVFVFAVSLLTFHTVNADVYKEWKCNSDLTCGSDCDGNSYKNLGANSDTTFTFSADPGVYECILEIKTTGYGFTGTTPELNEYSDVYVNDIFLGSTSDLFCNSAEIPPLCGNGVCDESEKQSKNCPEDCCAAMHDPSNCGNYPCSYCAGGTCMWYSYSWYGVNSGGVCRDGGCYDLSPNIRAGKGCNDNYVDSLINEGNIDCCSCYYHSRWCGDCSPDPGDSYPPYGYEGMTCKTKTPKYCTDVTYLEDCNSGGIPQQIGNPDCEFASDQYILKGIVNGNQGVRCGYILDDEQNVKLMAYFHFMHPEDPNYICCFGYELDDDLYCVRNEECKSRNCDNNVCGGDGNGNGNGNGVCNHNNECEPADGETHANCPSDCDCDYDNDCIVYEEICVSHFCEEICNNNNKCESERGEDEMNCPDDCIPMASFDFVIVALILVISIILSQRFVFRKDLTYLCQIFKMNLGKIALIASIAFILSFSYHLSYASAQTGQRLWECGNGLTCGSSCDGNSYKSLNNNDYTFSFNADPGTYECTLNVKTTAYGFSGSTPETNEYSDVYINDFFLGSTTDYFCNTGDEPPPEGSECRDGEIHISKPEIYTAGPDRDGVCGWIDMNLGVDYSKVRIRTSGGFHSPGVEGSTIYVGPSICSKTNCQLPGDVICAIGDADKYNDKVKDSIYCDISAYVGKTLWACSCHVDSADPWGPVYPDNPTSAIAVCARGTALGDAGVDSNSLGKSCNNIPGDGIPDECSGGNGENNPPDTPDLLIAPTQCETDEQCLFRAKSSDPDGDDIKYLFDFIGDDTPERETAFVPGYSRDRSYYYQDTGTYEVKIWAEDTHGAKSSKARHTVNVIQGTHKECVNQKCQMVSGGGENECETNVECNDIFDSVPFDLICILITILTSFIIFSWKFVSRKDLTYLYQLFSMNAGKFVVVLMIAFVLTLSVHFSFANADIYEEWKCGSGLNCPSSCQGNSYKNLGASSDTTFTVAADPGTYDCVLNIKNTNYAFSGSTPELNEYCDVYMNNIFLESTSDFFCNEVGVSDDCTAVRCNDPADTECIWHNYIWYDNPAWSGRRCDSVYACNFPTYGGGHTCANAGRCNYVGGNEWSKYFFETFGSPGDCTGIYNNCCSAWLHGTWCGECDGSVGDAVWKGAIKSPKYCDGNNYGKGYCQDMASRNPTIEGTIECYWDNSHMVLDNTPGMPNNNPVSCATADTDGRYTSLLGAYHFGNDAYFGNSPDSYNTNYVCCFANDGTIPEGYHCVRNDECAGGKKCLVTGTTTECENSNNRNRKCTCGGGGGNGGNSPPDTPTIVNSITSCGVNEDCGFRVRADDSDGDRVTYYFDWDDGETTYTVEVDPNVQRWKYHQYDTAGTYYVDIWARDEHGLDSAKLENNVVTVTGGGYETHKECIDDLCEDVYGPGEDECQTDFQCNPIILSDGNEPEGDKVYFGISFDGFGEEDDNEAGVGVEGTTLSFQSGCQYCGDVQQPTIRFTQDFQASNALKLSAHQSHGLKQIVLSCTKLEPPVADAGQDIVAELTDTYVTVSLSGIGSNDPDGYIVDYRWDFGDGYFGAGSMVSHNYYDEGVYEVTLEVTDNDGLKDDDTVNVLVGDVPTLTHDYQYDGQWVNQDQAITLTATDESGIEEVRCCYGSGCNPTSGQVVPGPPYTHTLTGDMDRVVRCRAWDILGMYSVVAEFRVMIDKTAPVTTDNHDGAVHSAGYTVTLTCTDGGSGCSETKYCIYDSGGTPCTPSTTGTSVTLDCPPSSICRKMIRYYSSDGVNNQESVRTSSEIELNTQIPSCDMGSLSPYTTSTTGIDLTWSGKDSGGSESGVTGYKIWYSEDTGTWGVWNDVFPPATKSGTFTNIQSDHRYSFRCQVEDGISGWGSFSSLVSIFVDSTPPTATLGSLPDWSNQDSFTVSWSGDDGTGSGVKDYDVQYATGSPSGWSAWLTDTTSTSSDFTNANDADYYFHVRARDNADLQGGWSSPPEQMGVDTIPPTCSIDALPDYITTADFPMEWSGDDGTGSGVDTYDIDYSGDGNIWIPFESGTSETSKNLNLMDGEYYFRCRANDVAENEGDWSQPRSVTLDTRAPLVMANYQKKVLTGKNITVNATLTDVSEITNVSLKYGEMLIEEEEIIETSKNEWDVFWTFTVGDEYGSYEFIVITEDIHENSRENKFSFNTVLCSDGEFRDCGTDIGECTIGNQTCVDGLWGECLGDLEPGLEVCDGRDNDCDGLADDGIICSCVPGETRNCGINTGECESGKQTCTDSQVWGPCEDGYVGPAGEICDGKDNDCDGAIDNGAQCCQEGANRPCGVSNVGICKLGVSRCKSGVWAECKRAVMPESIERCGNDEDDDCDGETDEDCGLCDNFQQDGDEKGIDCGGPCPPCAEFPWFILSIIGVIILVVLIAVWWWFKQKGEELNWETVSDRWGE